ncbi:XamI restriction endonuclease [Pseudoxanthomonas sp. CF125]|nr:XamI restriction endonuclease [Pseudoxanthomonas sp. CF125]
MADWHYAVQQARKLVADALRASKYLTDIKGGLRLSGAHNLVYRQLLAPPLSQDQFALVCPTWKKSSETKPKGVSEPIASSMETVITKRLDQGLVKWLAGARPPSRRDVITVLRVISTLMAQQKISTARRSRLAAEQEHAVADLLLADGWTRDPSRLIDTRAAVPPRHFMHKTRFATNTATSQEVDIACGLSDTYVLAMECKVTNDETNSVKRINDVIKKAGAWASHWGSFVKSAALLQGVIHPRDVQRLSDAGIHVFWSHDLPEFHKWLSTQLK